MLAGLHLLLLAFASANRDSVHTQWGEMLYADYRIWRLGYVVLQGGFVF